MEVVITTPPQSAALVADAETTSGVELSPALPEDELWDRLERIVLGAVDKLADRAASPPPSQPPPQGGLFTRSAFGILLLAVICAGGWDALPTV